MPVLNTIEVVEMPANDLCVKEDELKAEDFCVVVEEPERLPGTDKPVENASDDSLKPPKVTNWADDKDHTKFLEYMKNKIKTIPKHSGNSIIGCERAIAYLKSLLRDASEAMKSDFEAKIDEKDLDELCKEINDMIAKLKTQVEKLEKNAQLNVRLVSEGLCSKCNSQVPMWHNAAENKMVCMKCEAETIAKEDALKKEANTPVLNIYMTPFERAIVGTLINSVVSGGKNIEEVFSHLKKKYAFTDREELAITQLVMDHGYSLYGIKDRGLLNENENTTDGSGIEFATTYYA